MANLKGPLFSLEAQKQLGKTLIYKMKGSRAFLTKYNKPGGKNPFDASPAQLDKRMLYNLIIACWQCKTDNQRAVFNNEAKSKNLKMSGWNLFYQYAINDLPTYLGLQGYWSFNKIVNGKILDLSGNENDGALEPSYPDNAPTLVDSINKKFGKALDFDGDDDYVSLGDHLDIEGKPEVSIIGRLYCKGLNAGGFASSIIAAAGTMELRRAYGLTGYYFRCDTNGGTCYIADSTPPVSMKENEWQFFGFSRNGDGVFKAYIDGEDVTSSASQVSNAGVTVNLSDYRIGGRSVYDTYGMIDEVLVYDRILSPAEMLAMYNL